MHPLRVAHKIAPLVPLPEGDSLCASRTYGGVATATTQPWASFQVARQRCPSRVRMSADCGPVGSTGLWESGPLWHRRYYDRVVRNQRELDAIREYIVANPARWHEDRFNTAG